MLTINTVHWKYLRNKICYLFIVFLYFSCNPESGNKLFINNGIAKHTEISGIWKLVARFYIDKSTQIASYNNQSCPTIINITPDTLMLFETVSTAGISGQCYFSIKSHYAYVESIGLVRSADTIIPYLSVDTLALSRKIVVRNSGVKNEISLYIPYIGQIPPKDLPCYCGDSIFSALSR